MCDINAKQANFDVLLQAGEAFKAAMAKSESSIMPPTGPLKWDGRIHRFNPDTGSTEGKDPGAYQLFADEIPNGWFMDWRVHDESERIHWEYSGAFEKINDEDLTRIKEQIRFRKEEDRETRRLRAEIAREKSLKVWKAAKPAKADHPYLAKKGLIADPPKVRCLKYDGEPVLIIPVHRIGGQLMSVQRIWPNGDKRFLKGGTTSGGMCFLGEVKTAPRIYVAEGYATGATVYEVTGTPVVLAFNAGNLKAVCKQLRDRWPDKEICIAADNDWETEEKNAEDPQGKKDADIDQGENPGLDKAFWAACAIGATISFPYFDKDNALTASGSDWNDYYGGCLDDPKEQTRKALLARESTVFSLAARRYYLGAVRTLVQAMNREYAVARVCSKTRVIVEKKVRQDEEPLYDLMPVSDFKDWCLDRKALIKDYKPDGDFKGLKTVSIASAWLSSEEATRYNGIAFDPERTRPGFYNAWKGWQAEPVEGDCELMLTHIREVICCGDLYHYDWLLDWCADIFQNPAEPKGVAVILRSEAEGTGKGTFIDGMLGELVKPYYIHLTESDQLTSDKNGHLADRLLIFADEMTWGGDKKHRGSLYAKVTEKNITIRRMFNDGIPARNYGRLAIASNEEWVIPARQTARRWFALEVSDKHAADTTYFGRLNKCMDNGGREAFLHFLLNRQIINDLRSAPKTEALKQQQYRSLEPVEQWWFECMEHETLELINGDFSESADWPDLTKPDKDGKYEFIGKKKLYDAYGKWHLGTRKSSPLVDSRSFGRKIKSMIIKACKDGKWDHEDRKQSIYSERRNYAIPPVEECREAFDAFLKGKK